MSEVKCTWRVLLANGYAFVVAATSTEAIESTERTWGERALDVDIAPFQGWNNGIACFHEVAL